jgi:hypothetical protein
MEGNGAQTATGLTNGQCIPNGAAEGKEENGVEIVEELPIRHEITFLGNGGI